MLTLLPLMAMVSFAHAQAHVGDDTADTGETGETGETGDTGDTGDTRPVVEDPDATAEPVYVQAEGCGEGSPALMLWLPTLALTGRRLRRGTR